MKSMILDVWRAFRLGYVPIYVSNLFSHDVPIILELRRAIYRDSERVMYCVIQCRIGRRSLVPYTFQTIEYVGEYETVLSPTLHIPELDFPLPEAVVRLETSKLMEWRIPLMDRMSFMNGRLRDAVLSNMEDEIEFHVIYRNWNRRRN